jgi:hypothetical protein
LHPEVFFVRQNFAGQFLPGNEETQVLSLASALHVGEDRICSRIEPSGCT